jgi:hypothetical protein
MPHAISRNLDSCLHGAKSFFTKPDNLCSKSVNRTKFVEKIFKIADPIFDMAGVIAQTSGASEMTLKKIGSGRAMVRTGKDVVSFMTIFNGIIAEFIQSYKTCKRLITHLTRASSEGHMKTKLRKKAEKYNEFAYNKQERIVALVSNVGNGIGSLTCIGGFTLCRPIINYEKHISADIPKTAHNIGKAFPTIMMVNHLASIVGTSSDIWYQNLAYKRAIKVGGIEDSKKVYKIYRKKMINHALGLSEKSCELINDVAHHMGATMPPWLRIPLNLASGVFGIAKELRV